MQFQQAERRMCIFGLFFTEHIFNIDDDDDDDNDNNNNNNIIIINKYTERNLSAHSF